MHDLPATGIASCQCEEVTIGNDTTARVLLYSKQGERVGESRLRGFSEATLDLVEQLKASIERDFAEHLGATSEGGGDDAGALFHFDLPNESGGRDFRPDS